MRLARLTVVVVVVSHLSSCGWAYIGWENLRQPWGSWIAGDLVLEQAAAACRPETAAGSPGTCEDTVAALAWLRGFYYSVRRARRLPCAAAPHNLTTAATPAPAALPTARRAAQASTYMVIVIGDIVPHSEAETLYTMLLVIVGASVNSTIIGLVVGVLAHVDEEEHEQVRRPRAPPNVSPQCRWNPPIPTPRRPLSSLISHLPKTKTDLEIGSALPPSRRPSSATHAS